MPAIDPRLLERLAAHLGIDQRSVYPRISKFQKPGQSRPAAALLFAAEQGININKYLTPELRAEIAGTAGGNGHAVSAERPAAVVRSNARRASTARTTNSLRPTKKVWVVVGRNQKINRAMFALLRSLGLDPLEWGKAITLTRRANPYIGDVLDAAFKKAQRVVVLMTPDDEAQLKPTFLKDDDEDFEHKLTGQPRPNVLFEAGYAMGKYPNNTVLVKVGRLRPFSDISGRHVVSLTNSTQSRQDLAHRLTAIGLDVDLKGTDWHSEGDFTLEPLVARRQAPRKPGRVSRDRR
jgi:predicted nucleotide-binding protein